MGYGIQGDGWKNDAMLAALGPIGWAGYAAKKLGVFDPSTRQVQQGHTSDLLKASDDAGYQSYVQGMRAQNEAAPPDPSKPFAGGQYGSFDEYKTAGLQANDLTGVYGNLKTFGPSWAGLTQEQRQAVTQGVIDAGLYNSKKGEVEITDPIAAKKIYDQVVGPPVEVVPEDLKKQQLNIVNAGAASQTKQGFMR